MSTRSFNALVPAAQPRIAVAPDGSMAAVSDASRVVVFELPTGAPLVEIGADEGMGAADVAWVGARLLVLARSNAHSTVHLVEPYEPRTLAQISLEAPMRLCATVGMHALVGGGRDAVVLTAGEAEVTPYRFPSRVPAAAGGAGAFLLVAVANRIEEWDLQKRVPKRRIGLPADTTVTAVGGSERAAWFTTLGHPARIEVISLVNRGQPRMHELPEPIASVAAHPSSDVLVCLGARSGRLYAVDIDGRMPVREITPVLDRVEAFGIVVGGTIGVLVAQANQPLELIAISPEAPRSWRDEVVTWSRAVGAGVVVGAPPATPLAELPEQLDLPPTYVPVLVLLYGAHLTGVHGVAPIDVARLIGWDEAVGRGALAALGIAVYERPRVALAPEILRVLDGLA